MTKHVDVVKSGQTLHKHLELLKKLGREGRRVEFKYDLASKRRRYIGLTVRFKVDEIRFSVYNRTSVN